MDIGLMLATTLMVGSVVGTYECANGGSGSTGLKLILVGILATLLTLIF